MPERLTVARVRQHAGGRNETYGAALLDIAQDHLLWYLERADYFGKDLVFKGGTSLRKCRLGPAGRFSTDIDLVAPDEGVVLDVCDAIDDARIAGFSFRLTSTRGDGRHWSLQVTHDELGTPAIASSVEFARRPLILPPEMLGFVPLPVHRSYADGVELPQLPVIAEPEACAEKLARYRRLRLGRDAYDLDKFGQRPMREELVRRLWVLKVWCDFVDDNRGDRPLRPQDVLQPRRAQDFVPDSLGILIHSVDLDAIAARIQRRYGFLAELDDEEARWAACDQRHRGEILRAIAAGGFS